MRCVSDRKFTPLGKGGGEVEFECLAIVEMTFLIEMIVDRRMNRGEFCLTGRWN